MKQRRKTKPKKTARTTSKEPLAEGLVVPMDSRGRKWSSMSDGELVKYAKGVIEQKGIKSRKGFEIKDRKLYCALNRRRLLDGLEFKEGKRNWASMSDDELVEYARKLIEDKGIEKRSGLKRKDASLYGTLRERRLLDKLGLRKKKQREPRNWVSLSDDELVDYAKEFIEENGIKSRSGLGKEDGGLYDALWKRKLLDRLEFEESQRDWASMSDEEIVDYAKEFIEENGIRRRRELEKEDSGLYSVLLKRKLLDILEFEKRMRPTGFFKKMSDKELVEYAKNFMKKKKIKSKSGLRKEDSSLCTNLLKRKLLDRLEFEEGLRNWTSMNDDELVEYAKKFVRKKKINGRHELQKENIRLYGALQRRKLLDRVGLEKKFRDWSSMNDDELVEHAKKFVKKNEIKSRGGLYKKDKNMYNILLLRGLLDRVGLEEKKRRKRRNWRSMNDDELVEHAKKFMKKKKIQSRSEFYKEDSGLFAALRKRKLVDLVFSDIEQAKEKQAVQDVFDALREFGGPG